MQMFFLFAELLGLILDRLMQVHLLLSLFEAVLKSQSSQLLSQSLCSLGCVFRRRSGSSLGSILHVGAIPSVSVVLSATPESPQSKGGNTKRGKANDACERSH